MKSGTAITTSGPSGSMTYNNAGPDAMTWASPWEMMNRTLEAFATRILNRVREEVANPGKPSRSQKNLRMTQMDASILG